MTRLEADVAVVGLGPAGVAAAVTAAEAGARVVAVDDGGTVGGQIWRHIAGTRAGLPPVARAWLQRLDRQAGSRVTVLAGAAVVDAAGSHTLVVSSSRTDDGGAEGPRVEILSRTLVLATGARERFLPFPGWTLPGVLGVGGTQALVKSGASMRGLRAVVAGSGPLLLPVAATLGRAGARVTCVAEQAPWARVASFAAGLWRQPAKLVEAARYRAGFSRYRTGTWVVEAAASDAGLRVTFTDGARRFDEACDLLACGHGLVPNLELARLLGCATAEGAVTVDEGQQTSVAGVLAAGEACGVGGADLALVEGEIAGRAAAGLSPLPALVHRRARLRAFARRLERAFTPRPELKDLARADTVVCRCEDVPRGRLQADWTPRQAKLYTRAGMGPCQGRVCGPALELLFGWPPDTVRPPLYPVPFASLKEDEA